MVSVIIPIYGSFRTDMLRVCLESLRLQKGIQLEVTVAVLKGSSGIQTLCDEFECKCED